MTDRALARTVTMAVCLVIVPSLAISQTARATAASPQRKAKSKSDVPPRVAVDPLDLLLGTDPAIARVRAQLLGTDPDAPDRLTSLATTHTTLPVKSSVTLDPSCAALSTARLAEATHYAIRTPLAITTDEVPLHLTIADVKCGAELKTLGDEAVTSTYIASYQPVPNPAYLSLQMQLQQAVAEWQRLVAEGTPDAGGFAAGFLHGWAEGSAHFRVEKLQRQLRNTPPYLSRPVELPYTAYRYRSERRATVAAAILLQDRSSGFADSLTIEGKATSEGAGVRGTLDKDTRGLHNAEPPLRAPQDLTTDAAAKLQEHIPDAVRTLTQRYFLHRAHAAIRAKDVVAALGDVLIVADINPAADELVPYEPALTQAKSLRLNQLGTLRLEGSVFADAPAPLAGGTRADTPAPRTSRTATLERALRATVTIKPGDRLGSGFFVTGDGYVVSNAHVVIGAEHIIVETKTGESFLARAVKPSVSDDLALLKTSVTGYDSLRIGNSDAVPVGTDVIAVGSPLGLMGSATHGIVSAVRKRGGLTLLQIDAAINPGSSGGPLLTDDGLVIGVTTLTIRPEEAESIGFAIASNDVRRVFAEFLK